MPARDLTPDLPALPMDAPVAGPVRMPPGAVTPEVLPDRVLAT
ncbi:hypothetical protein [Nonomuraea sp. PA05]|nr:hypothetical protein [Nonomuraea sp. PA05]